ncbi:hypothetical protein HHK36_004905 [Tetracentron sinense]|uniref:Uncharacterized protein n=1 Tax=Tetracentron sinense TaxID=13715 RepID=A0A834ZKP0_TETSI|nr:hypothetical protein HHK36_004905 [Tetracentron sinense]
MLEDVSANLLYQDAGTSEATISLPTITLHCINIVGIDVGIIEKDFKFTLFEDLPMRSSATWSSVLKAAALKQGSESK